MHERTHRRAVSAAAMMLLACVSRVDQTAAGSGAAAPAQPAVASVLVIEHFLRAVNADDLDAMARLFGTNQGPIARLYDREQVDGRMLVLASLLKHEDYAVQAAQPVEGRQNETRQLIVRMRVRGRETDVPYILVRSDAGAWLVEQIDVERVTGR